MLIRSFNNIIKIEQECFYLTIDVICISINPIISSLKELKRYAPFAQKRIKDLENEIKELNDLVSQRAKETLDRAKRAYKVLRYFFLVRGVAIKIFGWAETRGNYFPGGNTARFRRARKNLLVFFECLIEKYRIQVKIFVCGVDRRCRREKLEFSPKNQFQHPKRRSFFNISEGDRSPLATQLRHCFQSPSGF